MKIEIKHRVTDDILLCGKYESIKECLEKNAGANLRRANLRGADYNGEKLTKEPIQLLGLKYFVMIIGTQIKIGCEEHKQKDWWKFKDKEIIAMDGKEALKWWKIWKPVLKKMVNL